LNLHQKSSQESDLIGSLKDEISTFWQQGIFESFVGVGEVQIHYALFKQFQKKYPTLVIVPGRSETYLKYQELVFDLYRQGYTIYIIDHRGQGLSERLLSDQKKGYVTNFQDYVDDLRYLIENILPKTTSSKPYLLAHSMGGAIATSYMQDSPDTIKAAVISSPMLGFNSGWLSETFVKKVIVTTLIINNIFSRKPWYFFGQNDYSEKKFSSNKLSHSVCRYQRFIDLYRHNKNIQLGGVTTHWLAQSLIIQDKIFNKIHTLKTPILLLQAGADVVVSQSAQNEFCRRLNLVQSQSCPNGLPHKIEGAFHELFFEIDAYRDDAITQSITWFEKHK
jgi:lysophospholipase